MTRILAFAILGFGLFSPTAQAARWANQFIEFELPPMWQCGLEGAEWVCQSTVEAKKKEAIIVLAAKTRGDQDNLGEYFNYLKSQKTYTSAQGKLVKSELKSIKNSDVSGQSWVDALHLESELPGFYTRYLATVKEDIGVLITFSVNRAKYADHQSELDSLVKTLKVFRNAAPVLAKATPALQPVPPVLTSAPLFVAGVEGARAPATPKNSDEIPLPIVIGGAALILFLIWRRRRAV